MKKKLAVILAFIILSISIFSVPVMANDGYWDYHSEDGKYYYVEKGVNQYGWIWHNGYWYYCDPCRIENGTYTVSGKIYYFDADGRMATGWQYLLAKSGKYNWYYFNSSGAQLFGWQKISGKWYYLDTTSGAMATGWLEDGGKWYYLTSSGAMATGWQWLATDTGGYGWFYFNSSGAQLVGWQKIGGYWYYLNETCYTSGLYTINGKKYLFASSGKMLTGWQKWQTTAGTTEWFYFDSSGAMFTGWLWYNGYWYYLNESMYYGGWATIGGKSYYFDYSGRWVG